MARKAPRIQSPAEESLAGLGDRVEPMDPKVVELWERAWAGMQERERYSGLWERNIKMYLGKHWDVEESGGTERPAMNLAFAATETRTALLAENMGKIKVLPRLPSASESATLHQALLSYVAESSRYQRARKRAIKNISVMGSGVVEFVYLPEWDRIAARCVDTREFFVQPGILDLEDAMYCGTIRHVPLSSALARYPALRGKVFPGRFDRMAEIDPERLRQESGSGFRFFTVQGVSGVGIHRGDGSRAVVFEAADNERVTEMHLFQREPDDQHKDRYATYRYVVVNNVLVSRTPWRLRRVPYAVYRAYDDTWAFYAPASLEFLAGLQKSVDLRLGYLLDWLDGVVQPTLIFDEHSGAVFDYHPKSKMRRIKYKSQPGSAPPHLARPSDPPSALFQIIDLEWNAYDRLMGNMEILQGQRPVGVQTGEGLKVLSENANARIRSESRSVSDGDWTAAWVMLEMARHYLAGKVFRLGSAYSGEELGSFALSASSDFAQVPVSSVTASLDDLDLQIDFEFMTPEDRKNRGKLALDLFAAGVYDVDDLLDALDDPNRKKISAKFKRRQQEAKQAAEQQAAAQAAKLAGPAALREPPLLPDVIV